MKILIFGGNRYFGKSILNEISKNIKINITVINRGNLKTKIKKNINLIKCDRKNYKLLKKNLNDKKFDYVIDNCCYDLSTIKNTKKILKGNFHYIFASTVMVYLDYAYKYFAKENDVKKQNRFFKISKKYKKTEIRYGINKKNVETYIKNNFKNYTILRLHNVIGKNDFKNITNDLLKFKIYGDNIYKNKKIQICYEKDLVKAYLVLINRKIKGKNIFNITNEDIYLNKFIELRDKLLKKKKIRIKYKSILPLPTDIFMDNSKFKNKFDFKFSKYNKILRNSFI